MFRLDKHDDSWLVAETMRVLSNVPSLDRLANDTRNHRCTTVKELLANTKRYLDNYVRRRRQEFDKFCRIQVA